MNITVIFDFIKHHGGVTAVIPFDGGDDQGCIETIAIHDATGVPVKQFDVPSGALIHDPSTGRWHVKHKTDDDAILDMMCDPIEQRYGSFAFEGYVRGTCTWDAIAKTMKIEGDEEVRTMDSFSYMEEYDG